MEVYRWLLVFCVIATSNSQSTLQFVSVFFRHGSRTPEEKDSYPTDPYTIEDFRPMGWGQLTNPGKSRSYQLGKLLRARYDSFLGAIYTPETAATMSTDFDRTKMTALLVLAGLFPPTASQQWSSELSWNPIPYHMDKADYDYFLRRPTAYCPAYVKELAKVLNSDKSHLENDTKNAMDFIAEHSGRSMQTLMDVFRIYQTLNAEDNMHLTLPEWTQSVYPERIHAIAARQCQLENYNPILKRLNGGRVLGRVIENMRAKATGAALWGTKIFLYSGHENNVINILAALNLYEPHVPDYSAAVLLELHYLRESDTYAVKVLYARDVFAEPENLSVEGCDNLCPLDKFVELTRPHVPVNYTAECGSNINLG